MRHLIGREGRQMNKIFRSMLSASITIGIFLYLGTSLASAATVRAADSPHCDLEFLGPVVPGDLARLQQAVERLLQAEWSGPESGEARDKPLCLNSEGGALGEAAQIAQYIFEQGIGTVLAPDSICLSACAYIFMMGHFQGAEDTLLNRRMHYTARLGFHAPLLPLGNAETVSRSQAEQIFSALIEATALILRLGNFNSGGTRPFIDADLVERAFSYQGQNNFFEIDLVDHAGRWRIEVFGFQYPTEIDVVSATHACNNLGRWPRSLTGIDGSGLVGHGGIEELISQNRQDNEGHQGTRFLVNGLDNGYYIHNCIVSRSILSPGSEMYHEAPAIEICGENWFTGAYWGQGACDLQNAGDQGVSHRAPAFSVFPPDTRLIDLPAASAHIQRVAASLPRPSAPPSFASCWLNSPIARIVNVNEYVNLRRQADFSAPVIRQVPLGERVRATRADNITVIGQERDRQSCINACQAFGRNAEDRAARDRAEQCIQDNMLWYEVTDARNNRGWVSRRYLEETQ